MNANELPISQVVLRNYTGILHIDWKSHLLWTLSIICFILSRLWWLVPLPGDSYLPPYRTYPSSFLNNLFFTWACFLAARSLPIGLIQKPFTNGIHPNSVIEYNQTGSYRAIWSAFRHRSGFRYFFLASLVTLATLLGNALESELQSSVQVYYKPSSSLVSMNSIQCQHETANDYQAASNAFENHLITNSLSDVSANLLSAQPVPFSLSIYKSSLSPIQNISLNVTPTNTLRRRHYSSTTCVEPNSVFSNVSPDSATTALKNSPTPTIVPPNNLIQTDKLILTINDQQFILNVTDSDFYNFNTSQIVITAQNGTLIKLNSFQYTVSEHQEAIILYSAPSDNILAGMFVSVQSTNYTCTRACYPTTQQRDVPNLKVIADDIIRSIQSNIGLYGTSSSHGLVWNIINHQLDGQSQLVDALYVNPNCPQAAISPAQSHLVLPYTAARWTILGIVWVLCYVIIWLIGVYLIGYTEESWSQLVRTGYMLPQIIHNSNNLFVDSNSGQIVNKVTYLDQTTGKMTFLKEHTHGYSVTTEIVSASS